MPGDGDSSLVMLSPCCCCWSKRTGVLVAGSLSVTASLAVSLVLVYVLANVEAWQGLAGGVAGWLDNDVIKDTQATTAVESGLSWMSEHSHYQLVLSGLLFGVIIHLITSLVLILGTVIQKRSLFLPWLVTDMIVINIMACIFIGWTFLSFFVDLLIAIIFPIFGGTVLGLWIFSWRNVHDLYIIHGVRRRLLKQELQVTGCGRAMAKHK